MFLKIRLKICRLVFIISVIWFLVGVLFISAYFDSINDGQFWTGVRTKADSNSQNDLNSIMDTLTEDFSSLDMVTWQPAPIVPPKKNSFGEMGKAVKIPKEQDDEMKENFKKHQFNIMASDLISLNRSLADVRLPDCKSKTYPKYLPTTSIVIVFHNEAWSTLLRTVWSAINRSPRTLLKEIILVDDASQMEHLGERLEKYVADLPVPVHVYRMPSRSGLIRARLLGAEKAKGRVITFLDAHCECTEGWLEPLLSRIALNRKIVACPIIDVISDSDFEYVSASDMTWGGFNWKLNFRWYRVPKREMVRRNNDRTEPLRTPTMAGGLFAIERDYFYEIGSYDSGMEIWGGENLEMSFRIWQCGGELEIIPCSRVGHVFRDKSPYDFPGGVSQIIYKNSRRVAEVWMDKWKDFYYAMTPGMCICRVTVVMRPNYGYFNTHLVIGFIGGGKNKSEVWMCGGMLEIITCSHVGHVFRKATPYSFPGGTNHIVNHNNARLSEVWLDDWKHFYYLMNPGALSVDVGNITERLQLREKLKCKDFRWYLLNIYPESHLPLHYHYLGDIRSYSSAKKINFCLDTMSRQQGKKVGMTTCHNHGGNQIFSYTKDSQIMSDDNCLDASSLNDNVMLIRCHGAGGNQAWSYDNISKWIVKMNTDYCLEKVVEKTEMSVILSPCQINNENQQWSMTNNFKWQLNE